MSGTALLLLCVLFSAGASYLLKISAVDVSGWDNLLAAATNPMIILGGLCYELDFVSYVVVLQKVPLSLAQPVITAGVSVVTVALSTLLLKEVMSPINWLGLSLVCAGIYFMFMGRA
jgi:multidrug transporter EmrE-like cation transporter